MGNSGAMGLVSAMEEEIIDWPKRSPLAYQPRPPVPWTIADLLAVVAFYFAAQGAIVLLATAAFGPDILRRAPVSDASPANAEHVVIRLLTAGDPWIVLLCVVSAVIVAPIAEEFLFRVLLQGWLEAVQRRRRHKMPRWRRIFNRAVGPIVLSSTLFAALHFRVNGPQPDTQSATFLVAVGASGNLLTLLFAVVLLRWRVGATAADFGWVPAKLRGDIGLGLAAFAVIVVPIYTVQILLPQILPKNIAPDPIPLFFLAVALGFLYYRTHRIAPMIVVHAALNATSLALAWSLSR